MPKRCHCFTRSARIFRILAPAIACVIAAAARAQSQPATDQATGSTASGPAAPQPGQQTNDQGAGEIIKMSAFTTESTSLGNYAAGTAVTAAKMPMDIQDVPVTIQVLNSNLLKDTRALNLQDVFPYIVGLQREGIGVTDFNIRGFTSFAAKDNLRSMQVDGLPGLTTQFGSPATANIEEVEILKGPASLNYGLINPGGIINLVTKKPESTPAINIMGSVDTYYGNTQSFGQNMGYTESVDLTGPIDQGKHLLYRLIVRDDDLDTWRKYSYDDNYYFYPSLTYAWDPATWITTQVEIGREKRLADFIGLLVPFNNPFDVAPYNTFYGNPNNVQRDVGEVLATQFQHAFGNGWTLHIGERATYEVDTRNNYSLSSLKSVLPVQNSTAILLYNDQPNHEREQVLDMNLYGDVGPERFKNTLLFGVTGLLDFVDDSAFGTVTLPAMNVYNPTTAFIPVPTPGPLKSDNKTKEDVYSLYFSDHIKIGDHLMPSVGLRYDHEISTNYETVSKVYSDDSYGHAQPNFALLYLFTPSISVYASYSYSFFANTLTAVDASGNNKFPPQSAHQYELGTKEEFLDRKLNVTFSAYDLVKTNVLETTGLINAEGEAISILSGEQESKGLELESSWLPTSNLQLELGASYIPFAETTESVTPSLVGQRLAMVARLSGNFWARYNFTTAGLRGFGVGLGVVYEGPRVLSRTLRVPVASHTLLNPALYYQWSHYSFAINIDNALDEKYLAASAENVASGVIPGDPCEIVFTATAHF